MELHLIIHGQKDLAGQLYRQLREAIDTGRLAPGTRLPPSRLLAAQLGVRFASQDNIERWASLHTRLSHPGNQGAARAEFIGGATTQLQFPQEEWRRCVNYAIRQMTDQRGHYSRPEGIPPLRDGIARHIAYARGVNCSLDDVLVCNGAQQALDLLARVMLRPGDRVAMEDPGYTPARLLFQTLGADVVSVPVDAEGICVERIPDGTRMIYTTPSHQFPLGMPMSAAQGAAGACAGARRAGDRR